MDLTDKGAKYATAGAPEKKQLADRLIDGEENISDYTRGVCYDTAAYVRYLLSDAITPDQLRDLRGQEWLAVFRFTSGTEWDGNKSIPAGSAVGFYRLADNKVFHAAIAVGGDAIRAVNGLRLGNGWAQANLKQVLGSPNEDGSFNYDNTQIRVYISRV